MKSLCRIILIASLVACTACNRNDDILSNIGDSAKDQAAAIENEAEALEARADEAINQAINNIKDHNEALENQAEETEEKNQ